MIADGGDHQVMCVGHGEGKEGVPQRGQTEAENKVA